MDQIWTYSDARICPTCVEDRVLREAIEADADTSAPCSFCARQLSAPFDALEEPFCNGFAFLYDDADNSVSYSSRDGGYMASTADTWDLMPEFEHFFNSAVSESIVEQLRRSVDMRTWVERIPPDYAPEVNLSGAWKQFSEAIRHSTRFVYWHQRAQVANDDAGLNVWEVAPADALQEIGRLIEQLGLFKVYDAGTAFYRARTYGDEKSKPEGASRLGTPPNSFSLQGNRMSPAGIPMFYGGETAEVVLDEVSVRTADRFASLATFICTQPFKVVDLTSIPPMPSPFDEGERDKMWQVAFLRSFVAEISEPVEPVRDQVDYIPTQVMTEYLLQIHWGSDAIRGIRYPSAASAGGKNVVLNVPNQDCLELGTERADRLQLELISSQEFQSKLHWNPASPNKAS